MSIDGCLTGWTSTLPAVAAFRADGRLLVTTGPNGDLKVWDSSSAAEPRLLIRHKQKHRTLAASWNPTAADLLATSSTDGTITISRLDNGHLRPAHGLRPSNARPGILGWLSRGRYLVHADDDGLVGWWDVTSGDYYSEILNDPSPCLSMFGETDDVLRLVYEDGSIRRASHSANRRLPRTRHLAPVLAAAWSPCGNLLVTARDRGRVELHDEEQSIRWTREGTTDGPLLLAWHGDSMILVADQVARTLTALDVSGTTKWRTRFALAPMSLSIADGVAAVGGFSFAPSIVDLETGKPLSTALP